MSKDGDTIVRAYKAKIRRRDKAVECGDYSHAANQDAQANALLGVLWKIDKNLATQMTEA